ncbi:MAG TPA: hypothetical protein VGC73_14105, partial [Pyrinomonadaceae bacterium]
MINDDLRAVASCLTHFTLPLTGLDDFLTSSIESTGTVFEKECFGVFAEHFFSRPAVDFFGALVPEQDTLREIAYKIASCAWSRSAACSRICSSARLRSVMSRAIVDAPIIAPEIFLIGEMVKETSI